MRRIVVAALLVAGTSGLEARTVKEKRDAARAAEQACYSDATTLCQEFIPDEAKITACMTAKRAQLSPACRKIFDEGL